MGWNGCWYGFGNGLRIGNWLLPGGSIMLILVVAALAVGIWFMARRNPLPASIAGEDEALRVLRERYARGEIGREEFEERRDALR